MHVCAWLCVEARKQVQMLFLSCCPPLWTHMVEENCITLHVALRERLILLNVVTQIYRSHTGRQRQGSLAQGKPELYNKTLWVKTKTTEKSKKMLVRGLNTWKCLLPSLTAESDPLDQVVEGRKWLVSSVVAHVKSTIRWQLLGICYKYLTSGGVACINGPLWRLFIVVH